MPTHHVIVGAGPAGLNALETIRALDASAEITLICAEPAYSRMVLPYLIAGDIGEQAVFTGNDEGFAERRVRTLFGRRVSRIDTAKHSLDLDDGSSEPYDRLLLATGSHAALPPIEGADGEGVIAIWTLDDANRFLSGTTREVAIVGAGFIAFTILDAVVKRADEVRFIEIESQILPRMLDAEAAGMMQAQLAKRGIGVQTGTSALRIEQTGGRRRLHLSSGEALECDTVVLATGVRPSLALLEGSGIETDHGILVDAHLRTSASDVYAAGDVAQGPDLMGGPRRVQAIQPTAVDHGRVAGANMAGEDVAYSGSLTMNIVAAQGLEACSFGRWDEDGDVVSVSNPGNRVYRKYVFEGSRMVGATLVGPTVTVSNANDAGMLKGLVQTGVALGPWKAYLEENPLDLRRAYVASGAAKALLDSTLLAGRVSSGRGFRFPALAPVRARSPHHAAIVRSAP